jgi:low affinity Fe/Cu permease
MPQGERTLGSWLERSSQRITSWVGSSWSFGVAFTVVLVWAITGPLFHFSDTWQLVINTGTTIVTFLMVFIIQRAQNKDSRAVHLKLNELVAATKGASNRLVDSEDLAEHELEVLRVHFQRLSRLAKEEGDLFRSHSVEEQEDDRAASTPSGPGRHPRSRRER